MRRIKHRDLTHYFLREHSQLPRAYVASCERFFKSLKLHGSGARAQASSSKQQAASGKQQAASLNSNTIK
jgi:hypothetical protein